MLPFNKLLYILTKEDKKKSLGLLFLIILMAFFDALGVASIMPFTMLLTGSKDLDESIYLSTLTKITGSEGYNDTIFYIGLLTLVILLISLTLKAITSYAMQRYTLLREYTISVRLLRKYLYQNYDWYTGRNSSALTKNIISEVGILVGNGLMPLFTVISQFLVSCAILISLSIINFKIAMIVFSIVGGLYFIIMLTTNNILKVLAETRSDMNEKRFSAVSQIFLAFKEIKFRNKENDFKKMFSLPSYEYAKAQAAVQIIAQLPRFLVEALAFGGLITVILITLSIGENLESLIPILVLYIFAGYRLLPAVQQLYANFAYLKYAKPAIELIYDEMKTLNIQENDNVTPIVSKAPYALRMNSVSYSYPNANKKALNEINLDIKATSKVGIIGSSGCGKSTLIDLMLGLIYPSDGEVYVCDQLINNVNRKNLCEFMGYVPQSIFLSDKTIAENIAFALPRKDVALPQVIAAAKTAQIHDFIMNELPEQYKTLVGENGIRLSGGQKQRIGIARALYLKPKILILDEATSALDNVTERLIIEALDNKKYQDITMVIISHRLNALKKCDKIYHIKNGSIANSGSFDDLERISAEFRTMLDKKIVNEEEN
jgi:ATP-binding cassette, subfamily B, bacterial PglK